MNKSFITRITLVAKQTYKLGGRTGITYGGYPEEPYDGQKYIIFTSPESEDYEIFPDAAAAKKFDPNNCVEVELFEWFDMFKGKTKLKDIADPRKKEA